jgi:hypothetical protein
MKTVRRFTLGILGSLGLMVALPSCVVVDPGYVSVTSVGYNAGYCAPRRVVPALDCYNTGYYAPSTCVTPIYGGYRRGFGGFGGGCAPVPSCYVPPTPCYGGW